MKSLLLFFILFSFGHAKLYQSASESDYPPYCIVANSQADGFSVELLKESLKAMNHEVTFYVDTWANIKHDLEIGTIDVLPLVGRTPEREKIFDFTIPYLVMRGAIVVRKQNNTIHTFDDLNHKTVLVMQDDNTHEFLLRQEGLYQVQTKPSFKEALEALAKEEGDAVFIQKLVATQLIKELKLKNLKIVPINIEGFRQDFSFAVKEGDKELLSVLNEGLSIIMANGTYDKLFQQWLAPLYKEDTKNKELVKMLGVVILLLSVAAIISFMWHISLKKQVERKTKALNATQKELEELNNSLQATIQKALEELRTKDKLMLTQSRQAAMGEMISIIAHQWRQPLSVISMAVNNLTLDAELEEYITTEEVKKTTSQIEKQVRHLSSTIDDFRDFFRPNKKKQEIHISDILDATLHIVGPSLHNHAIAFERHIDEDIPLFIYRNEMIQVLMNLINNAKDALVGKHHPKIIFSSHVTASSVTFAIQDNGGGIDEKILHKLGEPYVSTKSLSGTGLGIYVSKMIIEKHFGGLLVWENQQDGACFTLSFPR